MNELTHAEDRIQADRAEVNTRFPLLAALPEEGTRAEQIFARFKIFHCDNPKVFDLFCRFAFEVIRAGRTRYSADAILHRIRWHVEIETKGDGGLKLNNDLAAYYSRLFAVAYPAHATLFEQRKRTSVNRSAYSPDLAVTHTEGPTDEASLIYELTELAHLNSREFSR